MHIIPTILVLLAIVTSLAVAARRVNLPYPSIMVIGGLAISFIPRLPAVNLDPDVFFTLFLPPLLYAAAWQTSWRDFRRNLRPISLLAIGFVLFTTAAIAWLARKLVPGMTWPAACALGAIISPPDAIAATAIAGRLGVPRRIITILEGESLANDASGLTLYRLAVAAAVTGSFSWWSAIGQGIYTVVGGIAFGLALGWVVIRIHKKLEDPLVETVITLVTPFAAFIPAEAMHFSGVLAVVTMGLYVSRHGHEIFSPDTRLHAMNVWDTTVFMLNGLVFVLVGLQLPLVLRHIHESGESTLLLIGWAAGLCAVMLLTRIIWVFPASYLPRLLVPAIRRADPTPPWQPVFFIAYTGMRGAASLAAALALPIFVAGGVAFPNRNLIIFLTFAAILATLVVQSLTLPTLVRWLKLESDGEGQCEEWEARLRAARAALEYVVELETRLGEGPRDGQDRKTLRRLRARYEERVERMSEVEGDEREGRCAAEQDVDARLYSEVLSAERHALVQLRNKEIISDQVMRRIERDLDLEESRFAPSAFAAE